jgi:flagella basal body P-ring formation protein FlgA
MSKSSYSSKCLAFDQEKFARDLADYRTENNNLTRQKMSMWLDCSQSYLTDIENNGKVPRIDVFFTCCTLMNKDPWVYIKQTVNR